MTRPSNPHPTHLKTPLPPLREREGPTAKRSEGEGARLRKTLFLCALLTVSTGPGCKKADMAEQQSYRTNDRNPGLPGQTTEQNPVPNTIAQEQPGAPVPQPAIATEIRLARGQQRYEIFCTPCHGATGDGRGMIVLRGYPSPPDFISPRLLQAPASHFYDTITNGKGDMYSYAAQIPPSDRWAIAAYIRALQLSRHARIAALPPEDQARLTPP